MYVVEVGAVEGGEIVYSICRLGALAMFPNDSIHILRQTTPLLSQKEREKRKYLFNRIMFQIYREQGECSVKFVYERDRKGE